MSLKQEVKRLHGNSLVVQWLGLSAFTAVVRVQSPVGELRSCMPCGVAPCPPPKKRHFITGIYRTTAEASLKI